MSLKEFIKPTKWKLIIGIPLTLLMGILYNGIRIGCGWVGGSFCDFTFFLTTSLNNIGIPRNISMFFGFLIYFIILYMILCWIFYGINKFRNKES